MPQSNQQQAQSQHVNAPTSQSANNPAKAPTQQQIQQSQQPTLPEVVPPTRKKKAIFKIDESKDKHAEDIPIGIIARNFADTVAYLIEGCTTQVDQIRAIFRWITSVDVDSLALDDLPPSGSPLMYMYKIKWQMGNHARLLHAFCRYAKIDCVLVRGINKSAAYEIGEPINRETMLAEWNAVFLDGEWRLIDAFWACTCLVGKKSKNWKLLDVDGYLGATNTTSDHSDDDDSDDDDAGEATHRVNEFYYLTDPEAMIYTHYPDDPKWQLLETQIDFKTFEKQAYIRERFFDMELSIKPPSYETVNIETMNGEIEIYFQQTTSIAKSATYKYKLFQAQTRTGNPPRSNLERYVMYQRNLTDLKYMIRFPTEGKFKFDIFGKRDSDEELDLVCSYIINCPKAKKKCEPLPELPEKIGWGPGEEPMKVGMVARTHKDGNITTNPDGSVEIRFMATNPVTTEQQLKSNHLTEAMLRNYTMSRIDHETGDIVYNIRLPEQGEYSLSLYANKTDAENLAPGVANHICNYLIQCNTEDSDAPVDNEPYPQMNNSFLGRTFIGELLNVSPVNHKDGLVMTEDGKLCLKFKKDEQLNFLAGLTHSHMPGDIVREYLNYSEDKENVMFDLDLEAGGEYSCTIYAKNINDPNQIHAVYQYLIVCNNKESAKTDIKKTTNEEKTFGTKGEQVEIKIPKSTGNTFAEVRRTKANDCPVNDQVTKTEKENMETFHIKVNEVGEYNISIFEETESKSAQMISSYRVQKTEDTDVNDGKKAQPLLINSDDQDSSSTDEPAERTTVSQSDENQKADENNRMHEEKEKALQEEERKRIEEQYALEALYKKLRAELKDAIATQDPNSIQYAIEALQDNGVPDKGEIAKAKKLMEFFNLSRGLAIAMQMRDLHSLENLVTKAEQLKMKELTLQLQMAKHILKQLQRIEVLKRDVLNLDQRTISELKSYSKPPPLVHTVMTAVFLLLGNQEKELQTWVSVQALIGKTGRESLKRKVTEFRVDFVQHEVIMRAQHILAVYELPEVTAVSAGLATFFVWANGMIDEYFSRLRDAGVG
ncbi:unnamed protein product [Owenia fusiformis]|uniref:KY-like immunoglobulin-like domain-containing protein n=1 Tax=Owenia fusiformis TaxID=6347 RepID=A0A8J1U058_OWEFU|nr:unnamed protein product [Owenia fusiformis]